MVRLIQQILLDQADQLHQHLQVIHSVLLVLSDPVCQHFLRDQFLQVDLERPEVQECLGIQGTLRLRWDLVVQQLPMHLAVHLVLSVPEVQGFQLVLVHLADH